MEEGQVPVVMCFSGHDPTGGAGLQADIEAIASCGAHATTVITAVTIQDTQDVQGYVPMDETTIAEQARGVLEDMPVSAFKIGMLGSVEAIEVINSILEDYPDLPVILDPVLSSGAGTVLADRDIRDGIIELLVPKTMILTPNSLEAKALATEADSLDACAHELIDFGCEYVLITGGHENTTKVVNVLYHEEGRIERFEWDRLPHNYHGSGCTLSASLAALLALGSEPLEAVYDAQEFTWETLANANRLGMGQWLPNRLYWTNESDE